MEQLVAVGFSGVASNILKRSDSSNNSRVTLKANCAAVRTPEKESIHGYEVNFLPKVDSMKARQRMVARLENVIGPVYLFNGKRLYLPSQLVTKNGELTVEISQGADPLRPLLVNLIPVKSNSNHKFMQGFFDALLKRVLVLLGQTKFKDGLFDKVIELSDHGVLIEPGMRLTIRESDGGSMLLLETFHFSCRMGTARQRVKYFQKKYGEEFRQVFTEMYAGKFIFGAHSGEFYRLDDVAWDMNPTSSYNYNGREITIAEYYELEHGVKIMDMNQPLFISRTSHKKLQDAADPCIGGPLVYLKLIAPELCHFSGITDEARRDSRLAIDISAARRLSPTQRVDVLDSYLQKIHGNASALALFKKWGIHLDRKLVELAAHVVPGPVLRFNAKKILDFSDVARGFERQLCFMKLKTECYLPVDLVNWIIVCAEQDLEAAARIQAGYLATAPGIGVKVSGGKIVPVKRHGTTISVNEFIEAIQDATIVGETQLVLLVLPKGLSGSLYNAVKRLCLLQLGVPTQAIKINNTRGIEFNGIISKMALQINCKLGGALWALTNPTNEAVMYVGIDTYHDRRKINKSVFALVVTLNSECTKYYTRTCSHVPGQETGDEIIPMFTRALREYYEVSKRYPTKISIFRDGISNAYLDLVKGFELAQFRWCVQNFIPVPEIIFMVFQKRTADWLFLNDFTIRNPLPGTIVDHTLTRTNYRDFLISCQLMRGNGCLQPSRCIVIEEDGYNQERGGNNYAQRLTFASSFMYYNWPGSIKSPAVCQYAHKAASLVGRILKEDPKPPLLNQLYYL